MAHTKVTKTYAQNTGTANTFSYSGSFDTFKESEVVVTLDTVKLTYTSGTINESASPREYSVNYAAKTVHIGGADLSSGNIVIRPETDMGSPTARATYTAGSSITATDLNNNQLQLLRKAMEYGEQRLASTGDTMTGDLTMGEDTKIIFEGATADAYETTLTVTDPTADRTITLPNVTGTVVTTGDTATVTATMLAANSVDSSELVDGGVDSSHFSTGAVNSAAIASTAVTTAKIAADAITGAKIADDAIDSEHYTDGSIDTAHIADSQITSAKIADGTIAAGDLASDAVTTAKIAADAITGAKIADDQINSEHYVDGSIDTAHIADGQVTHVKLANDAVDGDNISDDSINSEHYVDGSIDNAHIADDTITAAKIYPGTLTITELGDNSVGSGELTTNSVTTAKIVDGNVTTAKIAAANVTDAKLASNAVTTAKITDANVTTDKLAADSVTIAKIGCEQTTISDSDSHLPTSGAVVDYVAAQIAPIGGLEVIADEDNFPTTQPAAGVVISIADAGGVVFNGSGVSTTARTAGNGSDNVTINNAPSSLYSETLAAGVGMQVSSTGSSHTYNYHKILVKEADVKQLSDDINDFNSRYRVNAGEPGSNNDEGDLVYDTNADKMKVYDSTTSAWKEVTSTGDFKYLVMTNPGTTNAATLTNSTFDLKETSTSGSAASVSSAAQLIVSVNGVIQKANTGTSAPAEGFALSDADTIVFSSAPGSGASIFIVQIGSAISVPTPGDGTVSAAKIASGAVETAKIADSNVTLAKMAANSVDSDQYVDGSIDHVHLAADAVDGDNIADDSINSEHYVDASIDHQHLANDCVDGDNIQDDVINSEHIAAGAVDLEHMSSESVDEDNLHISNSPTNGYVLTAQSGNAGGLTWAAASSGVSSSNGNTLAGSGAGEDLISGGTNNTLIGNDAGKEITDKDNNTYIGYKAGEDSAAGESNVFVGAHAAMNVTSALSCTVIGQQAGIALLSGNHNSLYGQSAGDSLTTGYENTSIGSLSMTSAGVNAYHNVAVGYHALANGGNFKNVAVGHSALEAQTGGECNTALGYAAGNTITTGHNNVYLGRDADASANNVTYEYVIGSDGFTGKGSNTFYSGGTPYNQANNASWSTTSDRRVKKNIVNNNVGLSIINQIQVRNFEYKTEDEIKSDDPDLNVKACVIKKTGTQLGLIAQELETVLPNSVITLSSGAKSVNEDELFWHMLNAIKELSAKVTALEGG